MVKLREISLLSHLKTLITEFISWVCFTKVSCLIYLSLSCKKILKYFSVAVHSSYRTFNKSTHLPLVQNKQGLPQRSFTCTNNSLCKRELETKTSIEREHPNNNLHFPVQENWASKQYRKKALNVLILTFVLGLLQKGAWGKNIKAK